jgi:hypothetical protein
VVDRSSLDESLGELGAHIRMGHLFTSPWVHTHQEGVWADPILAIAHADPFARTIFLDASTEPVSTDRDRLKALYALHERLEPSHEERVRRADRYLARLREPSSASIDFGVRMAGCVWRDGSLDASVYVRALEPLAYGSNRRRAATVLRIIDRVGRTQLAAVALAPPIALEVLAVQDAADLQDLALDLLDSFADASQLAQLGTRATSLAPSVRARARALAGTRAGAVPSDTEPLSVTEDPGVRFDRRIARLAGINEARAVFRRTDVRCLLPAAAVRPIDDLEELLRLVLDTMRDPELRFEVDRAIDGISRLCHLPLDEPRSTAALVRRVRAAIRKKPRGRVADITVERTWLRLAARAWLHGVAPPPGHWPMRGLELDFETQSWHARRNSVDLFLELRCEAVAVRAAYRIAAPMLGSPTHTNGFIDPRVLVERLYTYHALAVEPDPCDAILALLRIAPEHRRNALSHAADLDGEIGRALRYALGAHDQPPVLELEHDTATEDTTLHPFNAPRGPSPFTPMTDDERQREAGAALRAINRAASNAISEVIWRLDDDRASGRLTASLWNAAAHARDPYPSHEQYQVVVGTKNEDPPISIEQKPPQPEKVAVSDLVPLLQRYHHAGPTIFPANLDAFFATGCQRLAANLHWPYVPFSDDKKSELLEDRRYIEPLVDPDQPLTPLACLVLALGLAAKHPDQARFATEATIAAIDDGRLDAATLGTALSTVGASGILNWSRLATQVGDVARVSELHSTTCRIALIDLIDSSPPPAAHDAVQLLELIHELSVLDGTSVTPVKTRDWLDTITGSGKTVRVAHRLLALPHEPDERRAMLASARALQGRLARAARWTTL